MEQPCKKTKITKSKAPVKVPVKVPVKEGKQKTKVAWSTFVSEYASKHGISYKEALSQCREDYYKSQGKKPPVKKVKKICVDPVESQPEEE